jgi:hypothetical protein
MRIEECIGIHRSVEDAFAYVSDVNHLPEWAGTTIAVKGAPAGPLTMAQRLRTLANSTGGASRCLLR